jgi:hypothetical protein
MLTSVAKETKANVIIKTVTSITVPISRKAFKNLALGYFELEFSLFKTLQSTQ